MPAFSFALGSANYVASLVSQAQAQGTSNEKMKDKIKVCLSKSVFKKKKGPKLIFITGYLVNRKYL